MPHAKQAGVTIAGGQIAETAATSDGAREWEAVRRTADIQYVPLPPRPQMPPPQMPEWLQALMGALGRALEAIFGPLGRMLGMSWPAFQWLLVALAALLGLFLLWRLVGPVIAWWASRREEGDAAQWMPTRADAEALLEDADRLAREGRFAEATHLLLRRSVSQIRNAHPDWLLPASTAREIARLPLLPEAGRGAFSVVAVRVERSLFAMRELDAQDWAAARAAYADFVRIELSA